MYCDIYYIFVSMRNNAIIIIHLKLFQPAKPNVEPNVLLHAGRGGWGGGGGGGAGWGGGGGGVGMEH